MTTEHDAANGLSPKQVIALDVLLGGGTRSAAAAAAKVHRTTIYSWLEEEPFKTLYFTSLESAYQQVVAVKKASVTTALENLMSIASDTNLLAKYRVEAAHELLRFTVDTLPPPETTTEDGGAFIYLPAKGSITLQPLDSPEADE